MQNWKIIAQGRVQGVGFRPFVYKNALELNLVGHVRNTEQGVLIQLQGQDADLQQFWKRLQNTPPPLAMITSLQKTNQALQDDLCGFRILPSTQGEAHQVLISPDMAVCNDCIHDFLDPQNRRYLYPFTNCTNCGPRLTITRSIPYDRSKTSMACFTMCPACLSEYQEPLDRRFHAQPNACPECGPYCWLSDPKGKILAQKEQSLQEAARQLLQGKILAIKGLGGFHLACNAMEPDLTQELRRRKLRWAKPLAVMVPDLANAGLLVQLDQQAIDLLQAPTRPIVLASRQPGLPQLQALAPDTRWLGLMLPYTPLHHILLNHYQLLLPKGYPAALIMTSGNKSGEPLALGNKEALHSLSHIADLFLLHNRDILVRCDDSVISTIPGTKTTLQIRRSRGFVPAPVFLAQRVRSTLGLGAETKNCICLTKQDQAYVSQHIGDLQNQETYAFFRQCIVHLQKILQVSPELLVADLHPDYLSSMYAREQIDLPVLRLQHHLAHIHAVLAENRHQGPVLGLALDGTGLGLDQTLWGGEYLYVDNTTGEQMRLGHLRQVALPGGQAAITEPWRMAQSYLHKLGAKEPSSRTWPWLPAQEKASLVVGKMLKYDLNSPLSSSCGRLFDAVSAQLGLIQSVQYEGQAAILLENIQDYRTDKPYSCPYRVENQVFILDTLQLFQEVYSQWQQGVPAGIISRRFHLGLSLGLKDLAIAICRQHQINTVALSGGVLQNLTLLQDLLQHLQNAGLQTLFHKHLPPNDACIALGQAVWARGPQA